MWKALGVLALAIIVSGCSSARGFDRGALSKALAPAAPATEEEIQRVLDLRPQLPRPFKLGIFFKSGADTATDRYPYRREVWNWQPSDKQKILDVGQSLQRDGRVTDVA